MSNKHSRHIDFIPKNTTHKDRLTRKSTNYNNTSTINYLNSSSSNYNPYNKTTLLNSKQSDGQNHFKKEGRKNSVSSSQTNNTQKNLYNLYKSNPLKGRKFRKRDANTSSQTYEKYNEDEKNKLSHPFISDTTEFPNIPHFNRNKSTTELIKDMIKLRNENFELKQEIEKLNNFREIGEIEVRKLTRQEEEHVKKIAELENDVRRQREEITKLKKKNIDFTDDELKEMIQKDFSLNSGNEDWQKNVDLYGKYIVFLKMDNDKKNKKLEKLERELRDEKLAKGKALMKIQENNNKIELNEVVFPRPGDDFMLLDKKHMNNSYMRVMNLMNQYKEELEGLFDALQKQNKTHEAYVLSMQKSHQNVVKEMELRIKELEKNKTYEELYRAGLKKVEELQGELDGQTRMMQKNLDIHKQAKEEYELELKDSKRKEVKLLQMIGDLQNEIKVKKQRADELELKFSRNKKFMKLIDDERKEIIEIKEKIKNGTIVDLTENERQKIVSRRRRSSSKGSIFRISGSLSKKKKEKSLKQSINLEGTVGGGMKIIPKINVVSRENLSDKIDQSRMRTIDYSSVKAIEKNDHPETEDFLDRITRLIGEGQKRTVLFEFKNIIEERQNPDYYLQRKVLAICARKYQEFKLTVNDFLSIIFQKSILQHIQITKKNKMDLLHITNIFVILGRIFYESRTFELDKEGPEYKLDWQKIIDYACLILKVKSTKSNEKLRTLQLIYVMIKNRFKESDFLDRMDLFTLFLKMLDDGNMKTKSIISKILEEDSKYEKELYQKYLEEVKLAEDKSTESDDQIRRKREDWEQFNGLKLQDMGNTISDCIYRYRDPELIEYLLNALDNLCSIPYCSKYLFTEKLAERLLDFCSKPLNQIITTTALKILNFFSEEGYLNAQKDDILEEIALNMKDILKKDKDIIKKDYSMFLSILDLLQFLVKNNTLENQQMSILNLLNSTISSNDTIEKKDVQRILKVNLDIYDREKDLYKKNIDPCIFNHTINLLCQNSQGEEIKKLSQRIFEIFKDLKKGNFVLESYVAEKLINLDLFGMEESLNILKEAVKSPENLKVILKNKKFIPLCNDLILSNNLTRPKVAFLLALVSDVCTKRRDVKEFARKVVMEPDSIEIIKTVLDSIENDDDPDNVKTNLVYFMKLCCLDRKIIEFQKIFPGEGDIKMKIKEIMEESPSIQLKDLFTVIYSQVNIQWNETQKREQQTPEDEEFSEEDDSEEDAQMNDPEEKKKIDEELRKKEKNEKVIKALKDLNDAGDINRDEDTTNQNITDGIGTTEKAEKRLMGDMEEIFSNDGD